MWSRKCGLALFAVLSGCGTDAAASRAHRVEIEARIEQRLARTVMSPIPVPAEISVPHGMVGEPMVAFMPVVTMGRDVVLLDGRAREIDALRADLATLREHWALLHPRQRHPGRVGVWADPALSTGEVARRLDGIDDDVWLLVADSDGVMAPPPCPAALPESCSLLATRDEDARDRALRRIRAEAIGSCRPLRDMFAALADAEPSSRTLLFRTSLPTAMTSCPDGTLNVDALEVLVSVVADRPEVRGLRLADLPGDSSVADAVRTSR